LRTCSLTGNSSIIVFAFIAQAVLKTICTFIATIRTYATYIIKSIRTAVTLITNKTDLASMLTVAIVLIAEIVPASYTAIVLTRRPVKSIVAFITNIIGCTCFTLMVTFV
jgi:uncharacterized YccA/Bax inhibitor family protein